MIVPTIPTITPLLQWTLWFTLFVITTLLSDYCMPFMWSYHGRRCSGVPVGAVEAAWNIYAYFIASGAAFEVALSGTYLLIEDTLSPLHHLPIEMLSLQCMYSSVTKCSHFPSISTNTSSYDIKQYYILSTNPNPHISINQVDGGNNCCNRWRHPRKICLHACKVGIL